MPTTTYYATRACAKCAAPFPIRSSKNIYCDTCRTATCAICGRQWLQSPSKGLATCSPECSSVYRKAPMLTCGYCQQPFKQYGGRPTQFCGPPCRYLAARQDPNETAASKRRGWQYKAWRREVLRRDGYRCQRCDATSMLHVHHLVHWRDAPERRYEVSNGLTLCQSCHSKEHGAQVTRAGAKRKECAACGAVLGGHGRTPYCRGCALRYSEKAAAQRATLHQAQRGSRRALSA